jgi:hypothetical protein
MPAEATGVADGTFALLEIEEFREVYRNIAIHLCAREVGDAGGGR